MITSMSKIMILQRSIMKHMQHCIVKLVLQDNILSYSTH